MSFNEKLQYLRKANKLSQEQLADMLDVTRQSVSKWESGTTYPEMDKLITMCKIFKCSLDDLTNDEVSEIDVEKKQTNSNIISNLVNNILEIINKTVNMFHSMSAKQIVGLIVTLFILGFFLCFIRIPFDMLEKGFHNIVINFPSTRVASSLSGLFNMIIDIVFFVLYILAFVYIYKIAYLDKYDFSEMKEDESEKTQNEKIKKEEKRVEMKPTRSERDKDNTLFCILGNIVLWFFRIMAAFCTIPFIFSLVFLFACGAVAVFLLFDGIVYIGILFGIIFAIVLNLWILELGSIFIFNKKSSFKRLMWTFFIGLAGLGISAGLVIMDLDKTTFVAGVPEEFKLTSYTEEYPMSDNLAIDLEMWYYKKINYEVNEALTDKILITVEYYDEANTPVIKLNDEVLNFNIYYADEFARGKKLWEYIKKDLADKVIRNYDELNRISIKISTSEENIIKLKKNTKEYYDSLYETAHSDYGYSLEVKISNYEDRIEELVEENEELKEQVRELEEYKNRVRDVLD